MILCKGQVPHMHTLHKTQKIFLKKLVEKERQQKKAKYFKLQWFYISKNILTQIWINLLRILWLNLSNNSK